MKLAFIPPNLVDGVTHVPISPSIGDEGEKQWTNCLVGHFIGMRLPYSAVNTIAHRLWAKEGLVEVLGHEHGFFFFRFSTEGGLNAVLDRGPWLFTGRHLVLKKWFRGLRLSKEAVNKIPVWAHLHNIPVEYWMEAGLSRLASAIGVPLYVNHATETRKRISFVRVCMEIEATKSLIE